MKFRSILDEHQHFYTESGEPIRKLYKPVLKKDGIIELEEDGFENIYDYIQSFAESVDINTIVARYEHGDTYALQQRTGMYGDFIDVPKSYMEVLNAAIDLERIYSENEDLRKSFGSLEEFVDNIDKVYSNETVPKIDITNSDSEVVENGTE